MADGTARNRAFAAPPRLGPQPRSSSATKTFPFDPAAFDPTGFEWRVVPPLARMLDGHVQRAPIPALANTGTVEHAAASSAAKHLISERIGVETTLAAAHLMLSSAQFRGESP